MFREGVKNGSNKRMTNVSTTDFAEIDDVEVLSHSRLLLVGDEVRVRAAVNEESFRDRFGLAFPFVASGIFEGSCGGEIVGDVSEERQRRYGFVSRCDIVDLEGGHDEFFCCWEERSGFSEHEWGFRCETLSEVFEGKKNIEI